jgi:hypothetical protein
MKIDKNEREEEAKHQAELAANVCMSCLIYLLLTIRILEETMGRSKPDYKECNAKSNWRLTRRKLS